MLKTNLSGTRTLWLLTVEASHWWRWWFQPFCSVTLITVLYCVVALWHSGVQCLSHLVTMSGDYCDSCVLYCSTVHICGTQVCSVCLTWWRCQVITVTVVYCVVALFTSVALRCAVSVSPGDVRWSLWHGWWRFENHDNGWCSLRTLWFGCQWSSVVVITQLYNWTVHSWHLDLLSVIIDDAIHFHCMLLILWSLCIVLVRLNIYCKYLTFSFSRLIWLKKLILTINIVVFTSPFYFAC